MPYDVMQVGTEVVRITCETGGEAGRIAARLNTAEIESGGATRFRVIQRKEEAPAEPAAWMRREYERLGNGPEFGGYRATPWLYEPWFSGDAHTRIENALNSNIIMYGGKHGHFAHVAKGDPAKIAFTATAAAGENDTQTRMRVGRYLQQFYSDVLSNERIQELCANWDVEFGVGLTVKFAKTSDEIEH